MLPTSTLNLMTARCRPRLNPSARFGRVLSNRDSFFLGNVHNYYHVQKATDKIWWALLWDFDLSLNHPLVDVASFGSKPLETRTLKKHSIFLAMFSKHITNAYSDSFTSILIERGISFILMAARLDNCDRVIAGEGGKMAEDDPIQYGGDSKVDF